MKTSFATIALSLVGAVFAAPTASADAKQISHSHYPYSIDSISVRHLTADNSYVYISSVAWYNDDGKVHESTTCQTTWNPSPAPGAANPVECADPKFTFWFPSGIKTLLDYEVAIKGPDGEGSVEIAEGPKWACGPYNGAIEGVDYECKTTNGGWFYVRV